MRNIVHYQRPWGMHPLHDELRQAVDRLFPQAEGDDASSVVTSQWTPRVDIHEEPARFVIHADLPGIDPQAVEVLMDKGVLTIKGERAAPTLADGGRASRQERRHGGFHRRFALPDSADAENIAASGDHGVLTIVIPKRAEVQPRRIQVADGATRQ